jgi:hypothetical protein
LRQDCARQQALVRASQRTIGLAPSPQAAAKPAQPGGKATAKAGGAVAGKPKRKRRPVARALKAVAALQGLPVDQRDLQAGAPPVAGESLADSSAAIAAIATDVVQRSAASSSPLTAEAACAVAPQA